MPKRPSQQVVPQWQLAVLGIWALFVLFNYTGRIPNPFSLISSAFQAPPSGPWEMATAFPILAQSLAAFLASFLIAFSLWRLGRVLRQWMGINPGNYLLKVPMEFGLGITAMVQQWLGLALLNLWFRPLLATLLALVVLWALWDTVRGWKKTSLVLKAEIQWPRGIFHRLLALFGFLTLFFTFAQGLTPESWADSLVYHLGFLADWMGRHGMADMPSHSYITFPFAGELTFLNGVILQSTETAKLLNGWVFLAVILFGGGWALEAAGLEAAWLAMGLTATFPMLVLNAWTTQVESLLALFGLLFLYGAIRCWTLEKGKGAAGWITLSGVFAGMVLSIKYTGGLILLAALLGFAWQWFLPGRPKHLRAPWVLLGMAPLFIVAGPWLLRNLCWTGNPVYPYLNSWLGARSLTEFHRNQLIWFSRSFPYDLGPWWKVPWNLIMPPVSIFNFLGPFVLAALPVLLWARSQNQGLKLLLKILVCAFPLAFYAAHIPRFHIPLFAGLLLVLACATEGIPQLGQGVALAGLASAVLCFPFLCGLSGNYFSCGGIWSGLEDRDAYLDRMIPGGNYQWASWIRTHTAADARVLLTSDPKGYYMDRAFYSHMIFDPPPLYQWVRRHGNSAGITRKLKELGVDYVVAPSAGSLEDESWLSPDERLTPAEMETLHQYFKTGLTPVFSIPGQVVYQVRNPSTPTPP